MLWIGIILMLIRIRIRIYADADPNPGYTELDHGEQTKNQT
jgi:hypothetical protein